MSTRDLVALLILVCLLVAGLSSIQFRRDSYQSVSSSSSIEDRDVRDTVVAFGTTMKMVSLLAPQAEVKAEMDRYYAPYLTTTLLNAWKADPSSALGRQVSSPWPDGIVVDSAELRADGVYHVTGRVVEITSDTASSGVAGVYPVELWLEREGGHWVISGATRQSAIDLSHDVTIAGVYGCIPHRDARGPQTLECALGLQEDGTGDWYALDTALVRGDTPLTYPSGTHMRVTGTVVPAEALNTDQWHTYDMNGIVRVTAISTLQ